MINAAKELGRTVGYKPGQHETEASSGVFVQDVIVSGRFVKLATEDAETVVKPVLGTDVAAKTDVLGLAADDTEKLPYNGLYEVIDNFCKYGKIAAYVCGGLFTIWDDGRGAVFADDVFAANSGTPLYINAAGVLSVEPNETVTEVGAIMVGSVIKAPTSQDGTLFFKPKGL